MLSGTVLNSATNAGVAHALVSYTGAATGFRFTDGGGNFHVADVPCQGYSLTVSKPGYVSERELSIRLGDLFNSSGLGALDSEATEQAGRQLRPTSMGVALKPESPPAQVRLVPVSSIAGIVLDENGEPLEGLVVQGIAVKATLNGADYVPVRTARTDDRGGYALLDITPGDYVVRLAGEVSTTRYFIGSRLNLSNDHRGMQPVYYPNGDSPSSASVLHLGPGERANVEFRHATEAAFDIDGRLTGIAPGAWTQMQLYRDGDRLPVGIAMVNVSSGQFRMVDVPRGSYTLRAVQYQADSRKWLAAEAQVSVAGEPIRNLVIDLSSGSDIPVSVSYEAGAQADGMVHLMLQPQHTRSNARHASLGKMTRPRGLPEGVREPASDPAQEKALKNVIPDRYRLTVQSAGNGTDYVASAKLGELDVLHGDFPIGGSAGELRVTVRGDGASVEGQVTFKGQPTLGVFVYLIPAGVGGDGLKLGSCDAEGHFRVQGVPPGDYRIQAWRGQPTPAQLLSRSGETLTLYPSEHRTVTLEAVQGGDPSAQGERGVL